MALPPGIGGDIPDGDRKRLMQRADAFAIGTGTREAKEREDAKEFDEALEDINTDSISKVSEEDLEKQTKETEDYREKQLLDQAEKRNLSGLTSLNAYPGLLTLPGFGLASLLIEENKNLDSQKRSGAASVNLSKELPTVSQELLQKLREAGLENPVESLDDPRLGKACEALNPVFFLSLQDNKRVHFWSNKDCHQRITIGLYESRLESAADSLVETLIRTGEIDEKSISSRVPPEKKSFIEPS